MVHGILGQSDRPKQNAIHGRIPQEILIQIFSALLSPKDNDNLDAGYPYFGVPLRNRNLFNVSLVCRSWCTAASDLLFRNIYVSRYTNLCKLHTVLAKSPRLVSSVRTCTISPIRLNAYDSISTFTTNEYLDVLWKVLSTFPSTIPLDLWFSLGPESPESLIALKDINACKSLVSLDLSLMPIRSKHSRLDHLQFPRLRSLTIRFAPIENDFGWPTAPHVQNLRLIDVRLLASEDHYPTFVRNLVRLEIIRSSITTRYFKKILTVCGRTLKSLVVVGTNLSAQQVVSKLHITTPLPALRSLTLGQRKWPFVDVSRIQVAHTLAVENLALVELEESWSKPHRSTNHEQLSTLIMLRQWITDLQFLPELKTLGLGISNPDLALKTLGDVPKQRNIRIIARRITSECLV